MLSVLPVSQVLLVRCWCFCWVWVLLCRLNRRSQARCRYENLDGLVEDGALGVLSPEIHPRSFVEGALFLAHMMLLEGGLLFRSPTGGLLTGAAHQSTMFLHAVHSL